MTLFLKYGNRTLVRRLDIPQIGIGKGQEAIEAKEQLVKRQVRDHYYGAKVKFGEPDRVYVILESKMNAA